jgi:hypothetical protein
MKLFKLLILCVIFLALSCEKPLQPSTMTNQKVQLSYAVDGQNVVFDSILYSNDAGNQYSIFRLEYYISNVVLVMENGYQIPLKSVYYLNIKKPETSLITLENVPFGTYKEINFLIGLDTANNKTGALPNNIDNNNMAWPDQMGGGYHFMKLEGNYKNGSQVSGFAMHLGNNANVVKVSVKNSFVIEKNKTLNLEMNINEWFRDPHIYDFDVDGNYSMSDMPAMTKLSANGKNVFKFK